jgi:AraC family transcriptional activator of pyochelin receptor
VKNTIIKEVIQRTGGAPVVLHGYDLEALERAKRMIETLAPIWPTVEAICQEVGINEFKFKVGFKYLFGVTPFDYHMQLKMEAAQKMLRDHGHSVGRVAELQGYRHVGSFCREFKKVFGTSPGHFKRYEE